MLPIPLLALSGVGLPLPGVLERGLASLLPGADSDPNPTAPALVSRETTEPKGQSQVAPARISAAVVRADTRLTPVPPHGSATRRERPAAGVGSAPGGSGSGAPNDRETGSAGSASTNGPGSSSAGGLRSWCSRCSWSPWGSRYWEWLERFGVERRRDDKRLGWHRRDWYRRWWFGQRLRFGRGRFSRRDCSRRCSSRNIGHRLRLGRHLIGECFSPGRCFSRCTYRRNRHRSGHFRQRYGSGSRLTDCRHPAADQRYAASGEPGWLAVGVGCDGCGSVGRVSRG